MTALQEKKARKHHNEEILPHLGYMTVLGLMYNGRFPPLFAQNLPDQTPRRSSPFFALAFAQSRLAAIGPPHATSANQAIAPFRHLFVDPRADCCHARRP